MGCITRELENLLADVEVVACLVCSVGGRNEGLEWAVEGHHERRF